MKRPNYETAYMAITLGSTLVIAAALAFGWT